MQYRTMYVMAAWTICIVVFSSIFAVACLALFVLDRRRRNAQVSGQVPPSNLKRLLPRMVACLIAYVLGSLLLTLSAYDYMSPIISWILISLLTIPTTVLLLPDGLTPLLSSSDDSMRMDESLTMNNVKPRFSVTKELGKRWMGNRKMVIGLAFVLTLTSLLLAVLTDGACSCAQPNTFSFRYQRQALPPACPVGAPCQVYLTMTQDINRGMIINFHSGAWSNSTQFTVQSQIRYGTTTSLDPYDLNITARAYNRYFDRIEEPRFVHTAVLDNLQPDTEYFFRVAAAPSEKDALNWSPEYKFRTPPLDNVRFVTGGDVGLSDNAQKLMKVAGQMNPHFIAIGGDLAYANSLATCYRRWDEWLKILPTTQDGHMIPLIASIGNHEVGGFGIPRNEVVFFPEYFGQSDQAFKTGDERLTYWKHYVGNHTGLVVLDSGCTEPLTGPQSDFMDKTLGAFNDKTSSECRSNTLALYHVPLFPSVRSFAESKPNRDAWMPLFDKHGLNAALENHDHYYSRTFPMKGGKKVSSSTEGTTYVGDGSMGVNVRPVSAPKEDYQAVREAKNFFFEVTLTKGSMSFVTYDQDGKQFDQFVVASSRACDNGN